MIVHAVILLEALIVLLVDDDEAEIGKRQKQRGSGTDHDARLAGGDRTPHPPALGARECGMPLRRGASEALLETAQELTGERDLGQHDERLPTFLEGAGDGLEIDLGLARAGDTVDERDGEVAGIYGGTQSMHRARSRSLTTV